MRTKTVFGSWKNYNKSRVEVGIGSSFDQTGPAAGSRYQGRLLKLNGKPKGKKMGWVKVRRGPISVTRFKDETEVLQMANSTTYGLGGGLWTRDLQRGHRVAAAIRSGMVGVKTYKLVNPNSPFGGVGQSGYGRDPGPESIHDYTFAKSVWVNVDANIPPFYKR